MAQTSHESIIAVVDDDESVRTAIRSLLRSLGFTVETFGSAEGFLGSAPLEDIVSLIVDVRLPGMSGLDLQHRLLAAGGGLPMVFISAHDDPVVRRRALAAGAVEFLHKPFSEKALTDAVHSALSRGGGGGHRSNPQGSK